MALNRNLPFWDEDPATLKEKVCKERLELPECVLFKSDPLLWGFISQLLEKEESTRLGSTGSVLNHTWMADVPGKASGPSPLYTLYLDSICADDDSAEPAPPPTGSDIFADF